jgi:ABC-type amino acid transport system permease subunit
MPVLVVIVGATLTAAAFYVWGLLGFVVGIYRLHGHWLARGLT